MIIKTTEQLEKMKEIGQICGIILDELKNMAKVGITTKALDEYAGQRFKELGAKSAPITEYDFPGYTCISINDQVAHGIPSDNVILQEGDLINIDVSGCKDGFYADTGVSFVVGKVDDNKKQLVCDIAEKAFYEGMKKAKAGTKLNQVGKAIAKEIHANGLKVIKNLTGHGIGQKLHEAPEHVLNYYDAWENTILQEGMCLAVEPFVSTKATTVINGSRDDWEFVTEDGSFVAQYEHTIVVQKGEPIILTKLNKLSN